jgi:hypothetical protein
MGLLGNLLRTVATGGLNHLVGRKKAHNVFSTVATGGLNHLLGGQHQPAHQGWPMAASQAYPANQQAPAPQAPQPTAVPPMPTVGAGGAGPLVGGAVATMLSQNYGQAAPGMPPPQPPPAAPLAGPKGETYTDPYEAWKANGRQGPRPV